MTLTKLQEPVDRNSFVEIKNEGLNDYEKSKKDNIPTHFTRTVIKEGRFKGYDEVKYYRRK